MTLADKIVVLKDGKVMQTGAPMELYHNPANLFVAGFLGAPSMNFLPVTTLGIRPQYLTPSDQGRLKGTISVSERLGTETVVEFVTQDGVTLMAALATDAVLNPNESVSFDFDPSQAHIFAEVPG